jgi:[glutamine synthetase] adenylyltransferase / [glutamine synthetase]-adenylyl-L-tyrosine phosphorylase
MNDDTASDAPLFQRLTTAPIASGAERVEADISELAAAAHSTPELAGLLELLEVRSVHDLLTGVLSGSPFLSALIRANPARLLDILQSPPEENFVKASMALETGLLDAHDKAAAMKVLRLYKQNVALLVALCDIGGVWSVMETTKRLSRAADLSLQGALRFLFRQAITAGQWEQSESDDAPEALSGYFILGMGKLGALELNYSSDIDLIVFFDPARAKVADRQEVQRFFVRMTQDLVQLMHERTPDGYVFRTDLRLRPDPGATQVALTTSAALGYYESVGQNWERAALMKARIVAGDADAGQEFLDDLAPFIWRKYLDFAAIADVHAMKRQIHAFRGLGGISVAGHNVKLGRGGIREIEFFVQTQQLIAGGRQPELRVRSTLEALKRLQERDWIADDVAHDLSTAYLFLRQLEHRIQMVADEQTHEMPTAPEQLLSLAHFCGYHSVEALSESMVPVLESVQKHYAALFEDTPELTSTGANMVFAGEDEDPETLATLSQLGFERPDQVLAGVRTWHRGRFPAVRSAQARETLTDVQPSLIQALSETADPDSAFASFDRFLASLPAGVQLFSLLRANPALLRLIADIMGTAPRLARVLSRRRRLLDAVLDPRTLSVLPERSELEDLIATELEGAENFEDLLDRARVVGSEQIFLIGIRILSGTINARKAGGAYALIAECLIRALQQSVEEELVAKHGAPPGGEAVVVAMGKLGGREMTASSDLDLIVIYDVPEGVFETDGPRPLAASQYYSRLTQRLITALSAPTAEGALYEVDMRLRPSGNKGPVATGLSSFIEYQQAEAWTWEHLALTRARVISGPQGLRQKVENAIHSVLVCERDAENIAVDVDDMRQRIWDQKQTDNFWDLKQVRGGLVDLEFVVQYLQLIYAGRQPNILDQNTIAALARLQEAGLLAARDGEVLTAAGRLIHDLGQILRLCLDDSFEPENAPSGLKELLARAGDAPSFEVLQDHLRQALTEVHEIYKKIILNKGPA